MQGLELIVDIPTVTLAWDDTLKCMRIGWSGAYMSGADYRAVLLRLLEVLERKRACRMLFDMRNMPVMSPDDQAWVQAEWMPKSLKAGLKYSAVVIPERALSRLTLRHIAKDASNIERERAYFETLDEASAWLKSTFSLS
jgi:hypothetical protein